MSISFHGIADRRVSWCPFPTFVVKLGKRPLVSSVPPSHPGLDPLIFRCGTSNTGLNPQGWSHPEPVAHLPLRLHTDAGWRLRQLPGGHTSSARRRGARSRSRQCCRCPTRSRPVVGAAVTRRCDVEEVAHAAGFRRHAAGPAPSACPSLGLDEVTAETTATVQATANTADLNLLMTSLTPLFS
jgi:hypothetical protein